MENISYEALSVIFRSVDCQTPDSEGNVFRHINDPLDERYVVEPTDHFSSGSLPPEEIQVRDALTATVLLRSEVGIWEFWRSQLFKPTEKYKAALKMQRKLTNLCSKNEKYRAAFKRLANSKCLNNSLRNELWRIIHRIEE
jgi:hypothetical protein